MTELIQNMGGLNFSPIKWYILRPSAYKVRVGGVSPRCGIEQIREGGIGFSAHSQSRQYLLGERFVPPTKKALLRAVSIKGIVLFG